MNNPDRQLDRSLEEYLRSFLAEDIVVQEVIKRAEQGIIPAHLDGERSKDSIQNRKILISADAQPDFNWQTRPAGMMGSR